MNTACELLVGVDELGEEDREAAGYERAICGLPPQLTYDEAYMAGWEAHDDRR